MAGMRLMARTSGGLSAATREWCQHPDRLGCCNWEPIESRVEIIECEWFNA